MFLGAIRTIPLGWKGLRIRNVHARIVKPLMFTIRVLALNHVVVLRLTAYAVLNRRLPFRRLLFRRSRPVGTLRHLTSRVVVIGCILVLRVLSITVPIHPHFLGLLRLPFRVDCRGGFHHRWRGIVLNLPLTPRGHTLRFLSLRRSPGSLLPRRSCSTENGCQSNTEPHSYLATRVAISMCDISCVVGRLNALA